MPVLIDREIIEKARAGDTRAFRVLVESNRSFVYSLAYRFVQNVGEAQDISQEAFIRLWKNLPRYREEVKLTTWLYKIVTNLCLDYLKSVKNRQTIRMEALDTHTNVAGPTEADGPLLDEELRMALFNMTAQLTPKQKAVFVLRDLEDLPTEKISEILSMSSGNVKSNLYYARKRMSEMIAVLYKTKKPARQ